MIQVRALCFRRKWLLECVVLAALSGTFAILACTSMTRDSLTFDELGHLAGGMTSWEKNDHRLFQQNGQFPKRWATLPLLAGDSRLPSTEQEAWWHSDVDQFGRQFLFETGNDLDAILRLSRSMMVALATLLGVVVYVWSRYLFGRIGACISLVVCTFCPTLLAHGRLVTSDVTAALAFHLALLCLWEVLHKITIGRVVCCAAAVGLLLVSKMSGLLIVPIAALLVALRVVRGLPLQVALPRYRLSVRTPSHQVGCLSAVALAVTAGAVLIVWACYDFRYAAFRVAESGRDQFYLDESIDRMTSGQAAGSAIRWARDWKLLPESYLFGLSHVLFHSRAHPAFMNGHYSRTGWSGFFPYAVMVKTPLPIFVILGMAAWACTLRIRQRQRWGRSWQAGAHQLIVRTYRTAPLWIFLVVYWGVALRMHLSIGHRHVLPTYPAVFILCGAAGRWVQVRHRLCTGALIAALACLVIESVRIWPHYLSYFNQIAGGPNNGYRHLVDSSLDWGQDLPALRHWLEIERQPGNRGRPLYLAYFGSGDPARSGIEATLLPGYLDWREEIDLQELQPGTYCISATMLQSVYNLAFGPWNVEYESRYQHYLRRIAPSYGSRVPLRPVLEGRCTELQRMIYEFEQLRFARLCATLRRREPDERVAYSIMVYHVSEVELESAIGVQ